MGSCSGGIIGRRGKGEFALQQQGDRRLGQVYSNFLGQFPQVVGLSG